MPASMIIAINPTLLWPICFHPFIGLGTEHVDRFIWLHSLVLFLVGAHACFAWQLFLPYKITMTWSCSRLTSFLPVLALSPSENCSRDAFCRDFCAGRRGRPSWRSVRVCEPCNWRCWRYACRRLLLADFILKVRAVCWGECRISLDDDRARTNALVFYGAQVSCHNTTVIKDACCDEYPGGHLLSTQVWFYDPNVGPADVWTLHGLWPDNCDGTYSSSCDPSRNVFNVTAVSSALFRI